MAYGKVNECGLSCAMKRLVQVVYGKASCLTYIIRSLLQVVAYREVNECGLMYSITRLLQVVAHGQINECCLMRTIDLFHVTYA